MENKNYTIESGETIETHSGGFISVSKNWNMDLVNLCWYDEKIDIEDIKMVFKQCLLCGPDQYKIPKLKPFDFSEGLHIIKWRFDDENKKELILPSELAQNNQTRRENYD